MIVAGEGRPCVVDARTAVTGAMNCAYSKSSFWMSTPATRVGALRNRGARTTEELSLTVSSRRLLLKIALGCGARHCNLPCGVHGPNVAPARP